MAIVQGPLSGQHFSFTDSVIIQNAYFGHVMPHRCITIDKAPIANCRYSMFERIFSNSQGPAMYIRRASHSSMHHTCFSNCSAVGGGSLFGQSFAIIDCPSCKQSNIDVYLCSESRVNSGSYPYAFQSSTFSITSANVSHCQTAHYSILGRHGVSGGTGYGCYMSISDSLGSSMTAIRVNGNGVSELENFNFIRNTVSTCFYVYDGKCIIRNGRLVQNTYNTLYASEDGNPILHISDIFVDKQVSASWFSLGELSTSNIALGQSNIPLFDFDLYYFDYCTAEIHTKKKRSSPYSRLPLYFKILYLQ